MPQGRILRIVKTLKVRVKDKHARLLSQMAHEVNQVWNYCNDLQVQVYKRERRFLSGFDFSPYTRGASQEFEHIGSATIQEVSEVYAAKRRAARKVKLQWRSAKRKRRRSLGWVPFKVRSLKWKEGELQFAGYRFRVRDSYGLGHYQFRAGAFVEDARGRWYCAVQVAVEPKPVRIQRIRKTGLFGSCGPAIGVDLGLKQTAVCSDGVKLAAGRHYRRTQGAIGKAQRANKRKRVQALHAKVKNQRRDSLHKFSRSLVNRAGAVFIGDVKPRAIGKTKLAKSVYDSGWSLLRGMLSYKCEHAGIPFAVVSEVFSSQVCSSCWVIPDSSPKGRADLGIREWACSECGTTHDRDINGALNILAAGPGRLAEGIPAV